MFKSKGFIGVVGAVLALSLPAPAVQASELIKLGKLLVTGKRAPSTEAKPAADKPAARLESSAQPSGERPAASHQAAGRAAAEPADSTPAAYDWMERERERDRERERQAVEPRAPVTDTAPRAGGAAGGGRSPAPQQGMDAAH